MAKPTSSRVAGREHGSKARSTHLAALLTSGSSVLVVDTGGDEYGRLRVSEAIHKAVALGARISLVEHTVPETTAAELVVIHDADRFTPTDLAEAIRRHLHHRPVTRFVLVSPLSSWCVDIDDMLHPHSTRYRTRGARRDYQ